MEPDRLAQRAQDLFGVNLTATQLDQLNTLMTELGDWNGRMNLTRITTTEEAETRHLLDSLSLLGYLTLADGARVADVGTGAGFPAFPLKIARPDLVVTMIEAVGKKVTFLNHIIQLLNLPSIEAVHARVEDIAQKPVHRANYDLVVARALAHMPVLLEYLLPLCKVGGQCVAMKGTSAPREVEEAAYALEVLGGEVTAVHEVQLPDVEIPHYLVVITKLKPTSALYPRRAGLPSKEPLIS